jgi:hypothetical protein
MRPAIEAGLMLSLGAAGLFMRPVLGKVEGAVIMGNTPSPRKTLTMTHTRLADKALAEFNELSGILQARS